MSDLIERLRGKNAKYGRQVPMSIYTEAADEIELLEAKLTQDPKDARCQLYKATQKWQQEAERCNAEIERLRAALERLANHESVHLSYVQVGEMRQIARAALEDK